MPLSPHLVCYFWFTSVQLCRIKDKGVCTRGGTRSPEALTPCSWGLGLRLAQPKAIVPPHSAQPKAMVPPHSAPWVLGRTPSSAPHCTSSRTSCFQAQLHPSPPTYTLPSPSLPSPGGPLPKGIFLYQVAPKKANLIIKVPQSHFQEALRNLALFQGIGGRINISFKCCTIKPDAFLCGPKRAWRLSQRQS